MTFRDGAEQRARNMVATVDDVGHACEGAWGGGVT